MDYFLIIYSQLVSAGDFVVYDNECFDEEKQTKSEKTSQIKALSNKQSEKNTSLIKNKFK